MIKCDVVELVEQTMAQDLGGLRTKIGSVVQLHSYWILVDVCKLASKVERQHKENRGK